ncbi:MAG: hypothetical protein QXI24_05915 [Acidilobaceae archaeon]
MFEKLYETRIIQKTLKIKLLPVSRDRHIILLLLTTQLSLRRENKFRQAT